MCVGVGVTILPVGARVAGYKQERFVEQMIVNDFLQGKLQTCKLAMGHSLKQPSESSNWLSGNHGYDLKVEGATPKKRLVIVADGEVSPPLDEV